MLPIVSGRFESRLNAKARVLTSVSTVALLVAMPFTGVSSALAADAAASQTAQAPAVEEVVVTGTRIIRQGYEAPTPVSVLSATDLNAMAEPNIADAVNRLPEMDYSTTTRNSAAADITAGVNNLNLRGLGPFRTLVLLDGERVVGSTIEGFNNNGGSVDVNVMPNNLISRVDVVTGGASAVYGSDALAGVVNFVLDKNFTGIKGTVDGGITTYGDDKNYEISLAAGMPFADDRGHFLLSGEQNWNAGVAHNDRPWATNSYSIIANPAYTATNGLPQYVTAFDTGLTNATRGGLITSGPLKGTMFLAGGAPSTFTYGSIVGTTLMSGGNWQLSNISNDGALDLTYSRENAFSRVSYDITDNLEVYGELMWAYTNARSLDGVPQFHLGNVTVLSGNPFIPASVQAQMTALHLTSFTLGTVNADEPPFTADNERTFRRYSAGVDGKVDVFDSNWSWKAYFERSSEHISSRTPGDEIEANYTNAINAVVNPANGQIVCASTLTNPSNGCVPYNPMGIGVNTQAALGYIDGTGFGETVLNQTVMAATATGEPFSIWAGPVSVALDVEHRQESVGGFNDALDQNKGYFAGNFQATTGHYDVDEGSVELVVPLAKNTAWAKSLDFNGAVRATSYSNSGYVTSWKVGGTYQPIDDITFRITRSRDIRAPNLGELYNAGRSGTGSVLDPSNGVTSVIVTEVAGNANLVPEVADETGVGAVFQPTFLPGFGASVDWYEITISDAIVALSAQQYVTLCASGATAICPFIQRNAQGIISFVTILPANVQSQAARGIDFEASYNTHLSNIVSSWQGDLAFRFLGNYATSLETVSQFGFVQGAGVNADGAGTGVAGLFAPHFRYTLSGSYALDEFTGTVTMRGIGSGVINNSFVVCSSGCPTSTATSPTITNNHVNAVTYFDLALNYKVYQNNTSNVDLFLTIENLLNKYPPLIPGPTTTGYYGGQGNINEYDRLGRFFHAGVRFKI